MRRRRAFTLIELLVVVAIIALLISILLPALSRAREQARITVCMANLRTISQAANAYILEFDDLPWALPNGYEAGGHRYTFRAYTSFVYGGGRPDKALRDWRNAGGPPQIAPTNSDVWRVPPRYRPMNPYVANEVTWDNPLRDAEAKRRAMPMTLPDFFKCPSDSTIEVALVGGVNPDHEGNTPFTTWSFWGASYNINWHWAYYYLEAPPGSEAPYDGDFISILGAAPGLKGIGSRLLREKSGRWASEFVIFMENRLSYALEGSKPPGYTGGNSDPKNFVGWHRTLDYHAVARLDGSARYQYYDTRFVWGTGWTSWPNKPWAGIWHYFNDTTPESY